MTPGAPLGELRGALLAWYAGARRELPWRRTRDPYAVWVSEVMLQQTRVETVLPYFERFLAHFPTVEALAAAAEEDVLTAWSGLGYYRRARRLREAARRIVADGAFPRSATALARLPGIGAYTAAAVASIAFDEAVPVVDGNVERVVARLLALGGDPRRADARRALLAAAAALLDPERPGESNQALMELGATLCRRRGPACPACPLRPACRAAAAGEPERYPEPRRRRASDRRRLEVALVERDGRLLLVRRDDGESLLPGTWELPWTVAGGAAARRLARRYGGRWRLGPVVATVRHAITYRDLEVAVRRAALVAEGVGEGREARWLEPARLDELPVSSLVRKVLAATGGAPAAADQARRTAPRPGCRRPAGASPPASRRSRPGARR